MTPRPDTGSAPLNTILAEATATLTKAGFAEPRREAAMLVRAVAGLSAEAALRDPAQPIAARHRAAIADALKRRASGTPLSRIVGRREFWGLDFALSDATLDPRPDSETLIEAALARFPDRAAPLTILDLGTGTGCLALALLNEYMKASAVAVDVSAKALGIAATNAAVLGLGLRFRPVCGRWADAIDASFDLVISNPPYIRSGDIADLAPEVRLHDPPAALDGGADGMTAYRAIAAQFPRLVRPGGWMILEAGAGMAADIAALFADPVGIESDLAGIPRAVTIRRIAEKAHLQTLPKKGVGMRERSG